MECGKLYCFEGSEALSRLGLQSAAVPVLEKVSVEKKVVEKVSVEKKGRPKKSKKELEVQGEDLFAELILSAQNAVESPLVCVPEVLSPPLVKVEVVEKKKTNKKSEEKEALKLGLKAAKEAEKLVLKEKKEAEKLVLKEKKEAEKLALKDKKEAEKKSKKGEKKETKKVVPVSEKVEKVSEVSPEEVPLLEKVEEKKVPEEVPLLEKVEEKVEKVEEELDVVKKFEYEGVKYLKSKKTGIIYNMEQEVVGKWNEESKKIEFEEEDDSSDEEE
jgi:hypothetical protein